MPHRTAEELVAALPALWAAPFTGAIELIVRRPATGERGDREVLDEAELDPARGLAGDRWIAKPLVGKQITIASARVMRLLADGGAWAPAGDQLYVDLDLRADALPIGARLAAGSALLEVTPDPHTGCAKFAARFGADALAWTKAHPELRLRGLHARVLRAGIVRRGELLVRRAAA